MKIVWTAKAKDDAAKVLQYTRETFGARQFVKVRDFLRGVPAFLRQSPRAAPMEQALIFTGEEYRALLFRPRIKVISSSFASVNVLIFLSLSREILAADAGNLVAFAGNLFFRNISFKKISP